MHDCTLSWLQVRDVEKLPNGRFYSCTVTDGFQTMKGRLVAAVSTMLDVILPACYWPLSTSYSMVCILSNTEGLNALAESTSGELQELQVCTCI
jgi:hypothetical protein